MNALIGLTQTLHKHAGNLPLPLLRTETPASEHGSGLTRFTTKIIDGVEVHGTQCGESWEEAKAMGCHFDVYVFSSSVPITLSLLSS